MVRTHDLSLGFDNNVDNVSLLSLINLSRMRGGLLTRSNERRRRHICGSTGLAGKTDQNLAATSFTGRGGCRDPAMATTASAPPSSRGTRMPSARSSTIATTLARIISSSASSRSGRTISCPIATAFHGSHGCRFSMMHSILWRSRSSRRKLPRPARKAIRRGSRSGARTRQAVASEPCHSP